MCVCVCVCVILGHYTNVFTNKNGFKWMMMRSDLCEEHWLLSDSLCKQKSHEGQKNVCKCKLIFANPTDTLQQGY